TPLNIDMEDPSNNSITVSAEICNDGQDVARAPLVELFISADDTITAADVSVVADVVQALTIQPGACEPITLSRHATCLAFTSDYTVGLIVDPDDIHVELDEANNAAAFTGGLLSIAGPRCVCEDDSYDPEGGGPGNDAEAA